jgi:hypothetical protein
MAIEINIYCDESRHLEKDKSSAMAIGAVMCPKSSVKSISKRVRDIKKKYNLKKDFEIKWSKVSPSKVNFYLDLIDLFFDVGDLSFRGVIISERKKIDYADLEKTHDELIYHMHYEAIKLLLAPQNVYYIYVDMKDTQGGKKIKKLHNILCSSHYDFEKKIIRNIVQVQAEEIEMVQLCDLLIGALAYTNNGFDTSKAKLEIIRKIMYRSNYTLKQTTLLGEKKFNLLILDKIDK